MLPAFAQIVLAIFVLGIIWYAWGRVRPMIKVEGNIATLLDLVVVIAIVIALAWYVVIPLFSILFGMLGGGGFHLGGGPHLVH